MATDAWLPHRFASISDRLVMQNGVLLMGLAATTTLAYTGGHIQTLVVMYSINVFLTFTLSELGMVRYWLAHRRTDRGWRRDLPIHSLGLLLCVSILGVMLFEKLGEGAWVTLAVTGLVILVCGLIRRHYRAVRRSVQAIDCTFAALPSRLTPADGPATEFDPTRPTAIILVSGYGGLGIHILMTVLRLFRETFHNLVFVSVGVLDSAFFKEGDCVARVEDQTRRSLDRYLDVARRMGKPARCAYRLGTDVALEISELCVQLARDYARPVVFAGTLVFDRPRWYHRLLHNETAFAIQRRLKFAGLPTVILPLLLPKSAGAPSATSREVDALPPRP